MPKGTVKWFNDAKGYGFMAQDSGDDVFVHFASIEMNGYRTLAEGQAVEFEVTHSGDRGLSAQHVSVLQT
jgi:CspA family cold shock protein